MDDKQQQQQQHRIETLQDVAADEVSAREIYEEVVEEIDIEGDEIEDADLALQEEDSYRVVYPSSRVTNNESNAIQAGNSQSRYESQHLRMNSDEPSGSHSYICETESSQGRVVPAHVFAVRGNRIYRIDRSGGSTTTTAVRTLGGRNRTISAFQTVWQEAPSKPKPVRTATVSPPLAFRAAQASCQHNRSLTPALTAKLAPKKRTLGSKKPCHCTRSACLKLYCDCFANGEFCNDCDCKDCKNTMEHEVERTRAIRLSLERNPNAFKPKIGVATNKHVEPERLHQKGCHCKKSNCLKNYCECYEAKVPCTDRCKCISCRNTESDRASRFPNIKPTAPLTEIRQPNANTDAPNISMYSDVDSDDDNQEPSDPKTLPWFYMTDEVVEAATLCLVAQAEEMESGGRSNQQEIEKAILKEFGRCLGQVIESALKNSAKVTGN